MQLPLCFQLDVTEEDCFSLFPLETLVYLTPDSEHRESLPFPCEFTRALSLVFCCIIPCGTSVLTPSKRLWEEALGMSCPVLWADSQCRRDGLSFGWTLHAAWPLVSWAALVRVLVIWILSPAHPLWLFLVLGQPCSSQISLTFLVHLALFPI